MTPTEIKRIIEALILCHDAPMTLPQIKETLAIEINNDTLRLFLEEIKQDWSDRAVHLVQVASGYRFQTAASVMPYIDRLRAEKPAQYSRAVLETLAIIAYRQPVTRGDIEDIRGVTVSSNIIKNLEDRGWIDTVGHREVPGRPALLATTKQFLNDMGLLTLKELPVLAGQTDGETGQLELVTLSEQPDSDESAPAASEGAALARMTEIVQPLSSHIDVAEVDAESKDDDRADGYVHLNAEPSTQTSEMGKTVESADSISSDAQSSATNTSDTNTSETHN